MTVASIVIVVVEVVVLAVTKVLLWVAAIVNMVEVVEVLVIDVLTDVEIIVVGAIVIVLKFASTVPYCVYVSSGVAVDLFMEALAGVILGNLGGIGIKVLAGVNADAFAVVDDLDFPV